MLLQGRAWHYIAPVVTASSQVSPNPLLARLGARVRRRRADVGLTLKALAQRAGISPRFVSQLEAGQANIAIGRLAAVARALDLPLSELVAAPEGGVRARIDALLAGRSEAELLRCLAAVEEALGAERPTAVALLGLRGAGKSTLGPRLAEALGLRFVELDARIEEAAGLTLTEVFALHGEAYYRRLEHQCLAALLAAGDPVVVALGGGVVGNAEAFALARRRCTTIWLRADPDDHMDRVLAQGDQRPMADRPDAMAELRGLLAAREPLYRQADLAVDTSGRGVDAVLAALTGELAERGWAP